LEPEILIVDEVLAVGDYAFQQKCLDKMQDVSTGGRTVLFVSHNMGAVNRLCDRCILLDQGRVLESGPTSTVIQSYVSRGLADRVEYVQPSAPQKKMNVLRVGVFGEDGKPKSEIGYDESFTFEIDYEVNTVVSGASIGIAVFTLDGTCAFGSGDFDAHPELLGTRTPGNYKTRLQIPAQWLNVGKYTVTVYVANATTGESYDQIEAVVFNVLDTGTPGSRHGVQRRGVLQPIFDWTTTPTSK